MPLNIFPASLSFTCAKKFYRQYFIAYRKPPKKENGALPSRKCIKNYKKASISPDLKIWKPPSTADCTPLLSAKVTQVSQGFSFTLTWAILVILLLKDLDFRHPSGWPVPTKASRGYCCPALRHKQTGNHRLCPRSQNERCEQASRVPLGQRQVSLLSPSLLPPPIPSFASVATSVFHGPMRLDLLHILNRDNRYIKSWTPFPAENDFGLVVALFFSLAIN